MAASLATLAAFAFSPGTREHALAKWVTSQGGFVGKVAAETRGGLRGLFVSEDVEAGELLVAVPRPCLISAEEDPQWGLSLRELLTARLCGALTRGECVPYTESLPAAEPLLCDWSSEELELLQSAHLADLARGMPPFLAESCERIAPFVQAEPEVVAWAERMVRSRALLFDSGYTSTMSLVPIVDLANHRTPSRRAAGVAPIEPVSLAADGGVRLVAAKELRAGDEVHITYRYEGNGKLLLDYGFAELLSPEQPSHEAVRLWFSGDEAMQLGTDEVEAEALKQLPPDSEAEALRAACEAELARLPTSEEADRTALVGAAPSGVHEGRWRSALAYRIGQKGHLASMVGVLSSLLQEGGEGDGKGEAPSAKQVGDALRALRSEEEG